MEELKGIIGELSELRYQMQTDKPMDPITCGPDVQQWNAVFEVYRKELGTEPSWFSVSWLFSECFMYRKIADIIQRRLISGLLLSAKDSFCFFCFSSSLLKDLDPFAIQKEESYRAVLPHTISLAHFLVTLTHKPHKDTRMEFEHLLLVSV